MAFDPSRELAKALRKPTITQDRSFEASIDRLANIISDTRQERKYKNQGRQRTMSAIAGDVNRIYNNDELKDRKDKYQEYYNKYSSKMDEETLELGKVQLDNFDRQIEKNSSFEQFASQLESYMKPISEFIDSDKFAVGTEYTDEDVDKFRNIVQGYTDYTEKFLAMHGDRLQLVQNRHLDKQLAHGAYINDFIVDSFFDDKKIDEVEYKAYKQSIASNTIKPIQDYITKDDTLQKTATKNLINRIDANVNKYIGYEQIINGNIPVPNELIPDAMEGEIRHFKDLNESLKESIQDTYMDLKKQIDLDDKIQMKRAGKSYIEYQFPNLFKKKTPPGSGGGEGGGEGGAEGGAEGGDKYSSYMDSFSGKGDTSKMGMKIVNEMKDLDAREIEIKNEITNLEKQPNEKDRWEEVKKEIKEMRDLFGNNFPEDQKKRYSDLVQERIELEGTARKAGEFSLAEKGQQPIRQQGFRKNKIKSLKKELNKITNKRTSLKTRADQILKYVK
tara:strand:- start:1609 stop:3117 length:1509 start_codon:yes stop_codon:yes gene_type:complete